MTDSNYHHDILIIDHSGSMQKMLTGAQDGIQEYLNVTEQANAGRKHTVSVWEFDHRVARRFKFATVSQAREYELVPDGMTALYSGIVVPMDAEGADLAAMPDDQRPSSVTVTIISDGESTQPDQDHGPADVKNRITTQRDVYGWLIQFTGTNQDAIQTGASIGIQQDLSLSYSGTNESIAVALASAGNVSSRYVKASSKAAARGVRVDMGSIGFTDEERSAAAK